MLAAIGQAQRAEPRVRFILCGLPTLSLNLKRARTYAERMFHHVVVGNLDRGDAWDALAVPLTAPAARSAWTLSPTFVEATAGYPYFLQFFGAYLCRSVATPDVSVDDYLALEPALVHEINLAFFEDRFKGASPTEQRVLEAMGRRTLPGSTCWDCTPSAPRTCSRQTPSRATLPVPWSWRHAWHAASASDSGLSMPGGGLGIPYGEDEDPLDIDRLGERLATLCADPELADLPVLLEPGRFLVGPAGVLLARVLDVKEVGDRTIAILDAGIHTALRPALVGGGHRLQLMAAGERTSGEVLVAGRCAPGWTCFPEASIVFRGAAIWSRSRISAPTGSANRCPIFLSHPVPGESRCATVAHTTFGPGPNPNPCRGFSATAYAIRCRTGTNVEAVAVAIRLLTERSGD